MTFPLPRLTPESEFFWTSGVDGLLRVLRCGHCAQWTHPPVPECLGCGRRELRPEPVSGRGEIFSFSMSHHQFLPKLPTPYTVAIVELDEQPGLQLTSRIVHCPPEEVRIGMRVSVVFSGDGPIYLPLFEPEKPSDA